MSDRGRNPVVTNLTCTSANTEYKLALPAGVKQLQLRCRSETGSDTMDDIRYAFATGKVTTPTAPYCVIPNGMTQWDDNLDLGVITMYFASPTSGVVVEAKYWK